jgi:hypothetical protein
MLWPWPSLSFSNPQKLRLIAFAPKVSGRASQGCLGLVPWSGVPCLARLSKEAYPAECLRWSAELRRKGRREAGQQGRRQSEAGESFGKCWWVAALRDVPDLVLTGKYFLFSKVMPRPWSFIQPRPRISNSRKKSNLRLVSRPT